MILIIKNYYFNEFQKNMESGTSFKISTNRHNKKSSMRKKHTRFKTKSIFKNIENKSK